MTIQLENNQPLQETGCINGLDSHPTYAFLLIVLFYGAAMLLSILARPVVLLKKRRARMAIQVLPSSGVTGM